MPASNLSITGAYSKESSFAKNLTASRDFSIDQDGSDVQTVYECILCTSCESKYEQGTTGVYEPKAQSPVQVKLVGTDGKDYKTIMWTGVEIEAAIGPAYATAETTVKSNYGT